MEERIPMSINELNRLEILTAVKERRIKRSKAAQLLGISQRQLRRVLRRFNVEGAKGLVSKKVGSRGNRHLPEAKKALVIDFFKDPDHYDFGPTLAQEYLIAGGAPKISVTAIRNVMIEHGLWQPKLIRKLNVHPLRPRRAKMGELIQLDGSPHDWFEGRGPSCTLLVFIDDATSNTMHLKFVKSENTMDYLIATREYIEKHGRPKTFYPDKHSVFRVNREGALSGDGRTQFGRMLKELEIQLICANSPQAKGRVERRNRDFQNRLIKAMRIAKICDIEAANAFLPTFLHDFNQKFAKAPADPINAHRPLLSTHNLDKIFCLKYTRQLSNNLTLQYDNVIYQVFADRREYTLRKAKVTVYEAKDGVVTIEHGKKKLTAQPYHKMQARAEEVSGKELLTKLTEIAATKNRYKPGLQHPWKRGRRGFSSTRPPVATCG